MIGLVLEAAGEVATRLVADRVAIDIRTGQAHVQWPKQLCRRTGNGQAALLDLLGLLAEHLDHRVADMPHVPDAVIGGEVVDEQLQVHAHLVGRQTYPFGDQHGGEHVVHQGA